MRPLFAAIYFGMVFLAGLFLAPQKSAAAEVNKSAQPMISELRFGAYTHGIGSREEGLYDISGAVLFQKVSLGASLESFLSPRPHIGFSASSRTSAAYAGFTWTYEVSDPVFIELEFGGAVNNGSALGSETEGTNAMGCAVTFREGMNIGYRITPAVSIMLTGEHMSNANLCEGNTGLTNAGLRIGYRF